MRRLWTWQRWIGADVAGVLFHRRAERLAAIQHVQSRLAEIQSAIHQIAQQLAHHRGVFGGTLPEPQDRFAPVLTDSQCHHHLLAGKGCGVNQQRAQAQLVQPPLHHLLQLRLAGFDEMFADRALLQPVCLAELPNRLTVLPRLFPQFYSE